MLDGGEGFSRKSARTASRTLKKRSGFPAYKTRTSETTASSATRPIRLLRTRRPARACSSWALDGL
jgi:hypothetical protein